MLKLDRRIYVRVSEPDIERARRLAAATGLSASELVRVLLQMPAKSVDKNAPKTVVLDLLSANHLYREMRHWGYQRNQAAHALNRIAYYLERGQMDTADVLEALDEANRRLEAVEAAAESIAVSAREVASARLLFL